MTAEEILYSRLQDLFDGRVFPEHLPFETPLPALIYQRIGGVKKQTACYSYIIPEMRLTLFCEYPTERAEKMIAIEERLSDFKIEDTPMYEFDFATKSHCAIFSYLVNE